MTYLIIPKNTAKKTIKYCRKTAQNAIKLTKYTLSTAQNVHDDEPARCLHANSWAVETSTCSEELDGRAVATLILFPVPEDPSLQVDEDLQYYLLPSVGMWWHLFWFHILCGTTSRMIRTVRLWNLSVLFCGILRKGVTFQENAVRSPN